MIALCISGRSHHIWKNCTMISLLAKIHWRLYVLAQGYEVSPPKATCISYKSGKILANPRFNTPRFGNLPFGFNMLISFMYLNLNCEIFNMKGCCFTIICFWVQVKSNNSKNNFGLNCNILLFKMQFSHIFDIYGFDTLNNPPNTWIVRSSQLKLII